MPWQIEIEKGFQRQYETLSQQPNLFFEYMDAGRFKSTDQIDIFKTYLAKKYAAYPIDIVVVESRPAASLLLSCPTLFEHSRKCFLNPGLLADKINHTQSTVIPVNVNYEKAAVEFLAANPGKTIYLVAGSTEDGKNRVRLFSELLLKHDPSVRIIFWVGLSMSELLDKVSGLSDDSVLFYLLIIQDGKGDRYIPYNAAKQISEHASVPVYSLWTSLLGSGVVGGYLLSGEMVGQVAAGVSINEQSSAIPGTAGPADPFSGFFYDWRQLQRWRIDESQLPDQSTILFKAPTFYEHYYKEIIVFSLSVIVFISFLWNRRLEKEIQNRINAERYLQASESRFRSLSEATFEGIAIIENGVVIEINKNLSKMFGYQFDELLGMKASDFVVPECRAKVAGNIQADFEMPYEVTGIRKDGSTFPMEVQGKKISYKNQKTRVTVLRDLTERKQSEEKIKQLQGLLPICSICKKIRDDKGYWNHLELYISEHSDAVFSHRICDECMEKKYPSKK